MLIQRGRAGTVSSGFPQEDANTIEESGLGKFYEAALFQNSVILRSDVRKSVKWPRLVLGSRS